MWISARLFMTNPPDGFVLWRLLLELSAEIDPQLRHVEDTVLVAAEDLFVEGARARNEPLHAAGGHGEVVAE